MTKPLTPQTEEITKDVTKSGEMPQLSAEMERKAEEVFEHYNGDGYANPCPRIPCDCQVKEYKHFLATALEEQRQKVLSEVESWLDEMPIWIKIEGKYGYDPIHNKADISPFRQELRAKLNQLKGEK